MINALIKLFHDFDFFDLSILPPSKNLFSKEFSSKEIFSKD